MKTLIKQVMDVEVNKEVILGGHEYLLKVQFERAPETSIDRELRGKYSWTAYSKQNSWRSINPMRTTTYVKFFKTLGGAKRNFINTYLKEEV